MSDLESLTNLQATLDAMPATHGALVPVPADLYYACIADAESGGATIQTGPLYDGISFLYHGQWITPV